MIRKQNTNENGVKSPSIRIYYHEQTAKLQNLFGGTSKADLRSSNEIGPTGTTRTAGTADTTQKTYESANNSNSVKNQNGTYMKPPRNQTTVINTSNHGVK